MAGTRIFVLQMRDVIKTALFVILGLAAILFLIYLFVPKNEKADTSFQTGALYIPGTYSSEIMIYSAPLTIDVTVSDDEILLVELAGIEETHEYFYPLLEPVMDDLSKEIVEYQTTQLLPGNDSPFTGQLLLDAVEDALEKARI